jgi:taurine dioxygenase
MQAKRVEPFGYEISGMDLRRTLPDAEVAGLKALMNEQGFVLFRGQDLTAGQHASFARRFGPFSGHNQSDREGLAKRADGSFTLRMYDNAEGLGSVPELDFHSDNAHNPVSIRYLTLYGIDFGEGEERLTGGETLLANAAEAVDRLSPALRDRLAGQECHLAAQEHGSFARPCIERHCDTGRPYLIPSSLTQEIVGLCEDEFAEVMREIREALYAPEHVYRHEWREGDLILWDNRLLHHARAWFDNTTKRIIRRCAIADELEPTAIF